MTEDAPLVATIVVIFATIDGELQVLLVSRTGGPEEGRWALPGGRWDATESLDEAAARKLREETGARDLYLEQLFTTSGLDRTRPAVAVASFALVDAERVRLRRDEEWPAAWHAVAALTRLAFDNNRVIEQAVERVQAKLEYTNIAYQLLPSEFTVRDLQTAYEAIIGRPLDRRNFRKRVISTELIEATGEHRRDGAHRPARLYRFVRREPVFL